MHIPDDIKEQITLAATERLVEVLRQVQPVTEKGRKMETECPMCHKRMEIDPNKHIFKCFHCDFGGNSAIKFLMEGHKMEYPEALKRVADVAGIIIPEAQYQTKAKAPRPPKGGALDTSFKNQQLAASGLTPEDTMLEVATTDENGNKTSRRTSTFHGGSIDRFWNYTDRGNDMVIFYYDLEGEPVRYQRDDKLMHDFVRLRFEVPEAHMLPSGDCPKYMTPPKAGLHLYIPERLRSLYRGHKEIPTLFFTEGEKKAEKASKHGMPAFGMSGISCLVGKERSFPAEVVHVIERCKVQRVCFLMDSDWNELSHNLTPDKDAAQRPRSFFYAARRFRDWFLTLANRGIHVEVYLVLQTTEEKGIDDLLAGSLRGREGEYATEVAAGINAIAETHTQKHFDIHKISAMTDTALADLWSLNNIDAFTETHLGRLAELPEWRFGRNSWRIDEEGNRVLAQPLHDSEIFWRDRSFTKGDTTIKKYEFAYLNALAFFNHRGYYRYRLPNNNFKFVQVKKNCLVEVAHHQMRDDALDLVKNAYSREVELIDMLLRGSKMYFGPDQLGHIDYCTPTFRTPSRDSEVLLFRNKYLEISAAGVEEHPIEEAPFHYWADQVKPFDFERVGRMLSVEREGGRFLLGTSDDFMQCEFAQFLYLTGIFDWDKHYDRTIQRFCGSFTPDEEQDITLHLLSKMTAIGYLLHRFRDKSTTKAVIGMDGKITEVGTSQGRSGKSLLGLALQQMVPQVVLNGKNFDPDRDAFAFEEVTEKTQNLFIDDVKVNFDFESLYPIITGSLQVNAKGVGRFTLTDHQVPKLYITTNHAINGSETGSSRARQFRLAFSDFFDYDFQPINIFGHNFFDDWDGHQWNLFYNFMAECLELYFVARERGWGVNGSGLIEAPCLNLELRLLRQEMGENFFDWMNNYLGVDEENPHGDYPSRLNERLEKIPMMEDFWAKYPAQKKFVNARSFRQKVVTYCKYHRFRLNPVQSPDPDKPQRDVTSGIEYYTISNKQFTA